MSNARFDTDDEVDTSLPSASPPQIPTAPPTPTPQMYWTTDDALTPPTRHRCLLLSLLFLLISIQILTLHPYRLPPTSQTRTSYPNDPQALVDLAISRGLCIVLVGYPSRPCHYERRGKETVTQLINNYPPEYLRDVFRLRDNIKNLRGVNKLQVPKPNTTRYGKNSVKYLVAIAWNKISDTLRSLECDQKRDQANSKALEIFERNFNLDLYSSNSVRCPRNCLILRQKRNALCRRHKCNNWTQVQ